MLKAKLKGCCPKREKQPKSKRGTTRTKDHEAYSIILPLSLVRRLVGKLGHPNPGAKLKELDPPMGLGEQIRKVVFGVDVARPDAPFL
jgi:hypothetical protein